MPDTYDDALDEILKTVRDAGALDDSNGAEDWSYSDDKISEAKSRLKQIDTQRRFDELTTYYGLEPDIIIARLAELQALQAKNKELK